MARLTAAQRRASPHAGPGDSFPIPDAKHARLALSMAHYADNPAAVKAKVHAAYPGIGHKAASKVYYNAARKI